MTQLSNTSKKTELYGLEADKLLVKTEMAAMTKVQSSEKPTKQQTEKYET